VHDSPFLGVAYDTSVRESKLPSKLVGETVFEKVMILKSWFGTCLQGQICEICGHYIMRYIIWFEISEYFFLEEAEFPKEELAQICINVRGSGSLLDTSCMFKLSVSRKSFQHPWYAATAWHAKCLLWMPGAGFKDEKKCAKKGSSDILL
jgi:hypothetical protein